MLKFLTLAKFKAKTHR